MDNIQRLAIQWWRAEYPGKVVPRSLSDVYAEGVPRVRRVFAGEVRWSEASQGDKAIWIGRPRDVAKFKSNDASWTNLYDTIDLVPGYPVTSWRMFGCSNIGNMSRCNLQVPLRCGHGIAFDVEQMYAVTSRPVSASDRVGISLFMGASVVATAMLDSVVTGWPLTLTISPGQNFSVEVDIFEHQDLLVGPLTIRVHLEGQVRGGAGDCSKSSV